MEAGNLPVSSPQEAAISSRMSTHDIIRQLVKHGCQNITKRLDTASCTKYPLSTGGFGDVYRGKLDNATLVAIKTLRMEMGTADDVRKPLKHAARELHIWSRCRHPNVLPLVGIVLFRDQIGMVSRWIECGNLPSYIKQHPDQDRFQLSVGISSGLAYLHETGIVHGDLKGLNVLVNDDGAPMLADFGNAVLRDCTLNFTGTTRKNSLSPRWAVGRFISDDVLPTDALSPKAPELLDEREGTYSREADVYALGMTVLETFTGQVPYHDKSDHRVMIIVVMLKEPPTRPEAHIPFNNRHGNALWWLLNLCWANEPGKRPKASEVVELMNGIKGLDLSVKEGLSELEKRLQAGVAAMRATIKFAPISPVPAYPSVARVGYSHAGLTPAGPTPVGATVRSRAAFYPGIQAFLAARARSFKAGPARFHPAAARVGPTPIRTYPLVPVRPTARVNPDKTQHKQSIMQKILAYLSLD